MMQTTNQKMTRQIKLAFVAAISDQKVLNENLLKSSVIKNTNTTLHMINNAKSAAHAYNQGIDHFPDEDIIVFIHQDVYLPKTWERQLKKSLEFLESQDPNWAVLGVFGQSKQGERFGRVWDQGLQSELGSPFSNPIEIQTLDELLLIINNKHRLRFDTNLPGFHLYGTDLCATAAAINKRCYVIHAPVIHNSKRIQSLGGSYAKAYRYLQNKWSSKLPLMAPCSPITKYSYKYRRIRFGLAYRRVFKLIPNSHAGSVDPKQVSRNLNYE